MKFDALFGLTAALVVTSAGLGHANVVYNNDFSSNDDGFTFSSTSGGLTTSPSGNQFAYFNGAGNSGTLTLTGLTPGSSLSLSFSLYAVGSMDGGGPNASTVFGGGSGDYFSVNSGATQIFNQTFANYGYGETQTYSGTQTLDDSGTYAPGTGAATTNALGYTGFPQGDAGIQDAEYSINLGPVTTASSTATFTFFDNSNEGTSNEFYGIDDVKVNATPPAVSAAPEPSTWALMILGLGGIGLMLRRATKTSGVQRKTAVAA